MHGGRGPAGAPRFGFGRGQFRLGGFQVLARRDLLVVEPLFAGGDLAGERDLGASYGAVGRGRGGVAAFHERQDFPGAHGVAQPFGQAHDRAGRVGGDDRLAVRRRHDGGGRPDFRGQATGAYRLHPDAGGGDVIGGDVERLRSLGRRGGRGGRRGRMRRQLGDPEAARGGGHHDGACRHPAPIAGLWRGHGLQAPKGLRPARRASWASARTRATWASSTRT